MKRLIQLAINTARIFLPSDYLRDGSYYLELVAQVPNVRPLDHI